MKALDAHRWLKELKYFALGLLIAFLFHKLVGLALGTPIPLIAVVSASMEHRNPELTHYAWLEQRFGYNRSYVKSWPFAKGISVGDLPIVAKAEHYEVGDVIVYAVAGQRAPIIHRIVKINEDGSFQTKGDNNLHQWSYELSVRPEQVYGKVVLVIPYLGWPRVLLDWALSRIFLK